MRVLLVFSIFIYILTSCHGDRRGEAFALYREGERLETVGNLDSAVAVYLKAADLSANIEDTGLRSTIYNHLGDLLLMHGAYDRAMQAHKRAKESAKRLPDKSFLSRAYRGIGKNYYLRADMKEALRYFLLAQGLEEYIADPEELSSVYNNLSGAYCELGKYEAALQCNTKAMSLTADSLKIYRNSAVRGRLYMLIHQYDSSLYYLYQASRSKDARIRISSYYKLSDIPVTGGLTDSMKYVYLSLAEQLSDSVDELNRSVQIVEAEHLHQLESLKSKEKMKLVLTIVVLVIIVMITMAYLYHRYRHKTHNYQKIIKELNTDKRVFSEEQEQNNSEREKHIISIVIATGNSCAESFKRTSLYSKLKEKLAVPDSTVLTYEEQDELRYLVFKEFDNYIRQISAVIQRLSPNDSLLCCLALLKLTTKECAFCRGVSSETIRSQRARIKKKIPKSFLENGLFDMIFGEE